MPTSAENWNETKKLPKGWGTEGDVWRYLKCMKTGIQIKSETPKIDSYQKVKGSSCMAYGSLGGLQHTYSPRYPQRIQKMLSRLVLVKLTKLNTMYSMKVIESTPSILRESRIAFCRGGRQARTFERMLNCVGILQPGVGDRRELFCEN